MRKHWIKFLKKNNLDYITLYGLRHTSATLLAYNNIPMINIAKHMGHTNTRTTETYVHAAEEIDKQVNDIFEDISKTTPKLL